MLNFDRKSTNPKTTINVNPKITVNYKQCMETTTMSNYILHLPQHTWEDLAFVEREFPARKFYSTNVAPAKPKLTRTSRSSKSAEGKANGLSKLCKLTK